MKSRGALLVTLAVCPLAVVMMADAGPNGREALASSTSGSLTLDGSGDYVTVPDSAAFSPSGGITIEAWVKRNNTSACETIVSKNFVVSYWLGFCTTTGKIRFYANGSATVYDGNAGVPAGVWTHVAVTFDGTTRKYYINGNLDYSATTPGPLSLDATPLWIGADPACCQFSGSIAELRIWSEARIQTDIRHTMVERITDARDNLEAVWHLESSADEGFGNHTGTLVGGANFSGAAPTAFDHDPIEIPLFPSAASVDGLCSPGEYGDVRVPVWTPTRLSWAYVIATAGNVYVCMDNLAIGGYSGEFAGLYLDPDGDGGALAQADDYRISLFRQTDSDFSENGTGAGGYTTPGLASYDADSWTEAKLGTEWGGEFRFPRSALPASDAIFGMQFVQHWFTGVGDDYGWPVDFVWNSPNAWEKFQIATTSKVRTDNRSPLVFVRRNPRDRIAQGSSVQLLAEANDDTDLSRINLFVDGVLSTSCPVNGLNDYFSACLAPQAAYPVGTHTYWAEAIDHRGRSGLSSMERFFVEIDGQSPAISLRHSPTSPTPGQAIEIEATVTDASGIDAISISSGGPGRTCEFSGPTQTRTCTLSYVPPASRRIAWYWASATDNEGLTSSTGRFPVVFSNPGTDADGDGLPNAIENDFCTASTDPDSDGDALPDGWEVLGLHFPDNEHVDLPRLGANACRREIFIQNDYERGVRLEETVWPAAVAVFRDHGIALHVSENERPRPAGLPISAVTAEQGMDLTDAQGNYYFPPKRAWTHHYVYNRHFNDRSTTWFYTTMSLNTNSCPLTSADPQNDPVCSRSAEDQLPTLVHELGHSFGFGHGGATGTGQDVWDGDAFGYDFAWDTVNHKPNYNDIMNYGYYGANACYNPSTNAFTGTLGYLDQPLGPGGVLNESALQEAGGAFATAIAARSCAFAGAGWVPVFFYSCFGGSAETNFVVAHDGVQPRARIRASTYQGDPLAEWTTVLPSMPAGIDWNCNGAITPFPSTVTANISGVSANGDWWDWLGAGGSSNETFLSAGNGWLIVPAGNAKACALRDNPALDDLLTLAYQIKMASPDCLISSTGSAGQGEAAALPPEQNPFGFPKTPPTENYEPGPPLPNVEYCDGFNNDGDLEIDEVCFDADADGVIDALDNCPETPNADQADLDDDYLGDACQRPTLVGMSVVPSGGGYQISWTPSTMNDVIGFNVYRQSYSNDTPVYVQGIAYPTTSGTSWPDDPAPGDTYRYIVRPVNLFGAETDELYFDISPEPDSDGDGDANSFDNCANTSNSNQADLDGDGAGDLCDDELDGDGCSNVKEQQTGSGSELTGGRRNYLNPNDYFNPSRDGVNRVDDILLVVQAYFDDDSDGNPGLPPYAPGYNPDFDRTYVGPLAWNLGPPNGLQRVDDILNAVKQYFHDCS